jgi:single-strand DNA-binding protein
MDTYVTLHGNLVADPVQRSTASGAAVVGFRLASSGRRFDRPSGEFRDGDTLYIGISCWRSLGAHVLASLRKGDSVVVLGRLLYRTYDDKQGNRRSVHECDAIAVGPDLARCAADLRRPGRASVPGQPADGRGVPELVGNEPAASTPALGPVAA